MGVTGDSQAPIEHLKEYSQRVRKYIDLPLAIGFGIDSPEKVKNIIDYFDGIIVGSALVKIIDENSDDKAKMLKEIKSFIKSLKIW
jgi:tryptophan synthase alpha chain